MKRLLHSTFALFFSFLAIGQTPRNLYGFTKSTNIEVVQKGKSLKFPWAGGINSAHVNTIDLNLDGIQDLVLFDKAGKNYQTYLTKSSGGNTYYEYAPEYEKAFPPVNQSNDWALIRDYNCDGKKDLFYGLQGNTYVWENTSVNTLSFKPVNNGNYLKTLDNGPGYNLYIGSANLPGIADLDNDGALDLLTFGNQSIEMEHHTGQTPCGLDFKLEERCWGHFTETGTAPGVNLNSCTPHKKKTMDGSTTILPLDLNNDQVQDLILGNGTYKSLAALYNGGSLNSAHMTSQIAIYPTSHPINILSTPAAFYEDVDHDGLKDLIASPSPIQPAYSINKQSVHFYKNTGNANVPTFTFQQEDFLQNEMIDVGERSVPRLADLNGDGKLDLIVSNYDYRLKDSVDGHSYHYYQNTSSATQTSFALLDTNFMNISSHGIKARSIPTFGDLDGDGDLDAIVGDITGDLYYFANSSQSSPNFAPPANLMNISGRSFIAPFLYDIDSNGTLDLFVGNDLGTIYYYSNLSSSYPNFILEDNRWGGVNSKGANATYGHSIPYLFKNNGLDNLFVGSFDAGIFQFDSLSQVMNQLPVIHPTIGNGSIISSDEYETPFGTKHKNGRNQILIRASELRDAGLVFGNITGISFKITSSSNNILYNFYIRVKNTKDSVLNDFQTDLKQVINNQTTVYQGWHYFQFSDPFLWDGASSLVFEICFSGVNSNQNITVEMSDVGFNANAYGDYIDSAVSGNGCGQPFLSSTSKRPNLKLRLTPALANTEIYASGFHTSPAVADLNHDGYMDMIVGNMNGGLTYYEGKFYDVGIEEQDHNEIGNLNVYPNPGNGKYTISTPNTGNAELNIFNLSGKMVMKLEVSSEETQVDLQNHPAGMYLFMLVDKGELRTAKVIKH